MWDLRFATAPMRILEHHKRGVLSIAWCPQDSDLLLSAAKDNQVLCWNPNSEQPGGEVGVARVWFIRIHALCILNDILISFFFFIFLVYYLSLPLSPPSLPRGPPPSFLSVPSPIFPPLSHCQSFLCTRIDLHNHYFLSLSASLFLSLLLSLSFPSSLSFLLITMYITSSVTVTPSY